MHTWPWNTFSRASICKGQATVVEQSAEEEYKCPFECDRMGGAEHNLEADRKRRGERGRVLGKRLICE